MERFNRGLDSAFVELLNKEYDKGGWWRDFVHDDELFLAIRNGYVNVYYRGCSLLHWSWQGETFTGRIHYKYLLRPKLPAKVDPYVKIEDGRPVFQGDMAQFFTENLGCREALKNAAKAYAGVEKRGVSDILRANKNVLDVEIALGEDPQSEEDPEPKEGRVDLVALKKTKRGIDLVFFEAKHFANSEIRAKGDSEPKVVKQVKRYARLLKENRETIQQSYRQVCCNLLYIRGLADRYPLRHKILSCIADGSEQLFVDEDPRLVVFGFDGDQKKGKYWNRIYGSLRIQ